jgi:hypothetical protein
MTNLSRAHNDRMKHADRPEVKDTMDDYTFPFLLSIGMFVLCLLVAIAHSYGW